VEGIITAREDKDEESEVETKECLETRAKLRAWTSFLHTLFSPKAIVCALGLRSKLHTSRNKIMAWFDFISCNPSPKNFIQG